MNSHHHTAGSASWSPDRSYALISGQVREPSVLDFSNGPDEAPEPRMVRLPRWPGLLAHQRAGDGRIYLVDGTVYEPDQAIDLRCSGCRATSTAGLDAGRRLIVFVVGHRAGCKAVEDLLQMASVVSAPACGHLRWSWDGSHHRLPVLGLGVPALELASLGFAVFPLERGGKRPHRMLNGLAPAGEGGFKLATTDPAVIEPWWLEDPAANIGVPTGQVNRLLVGDFDRKHDIDGVKVFTDFMAEHGHALPSAPWVRTPTANGRHIWLRHDVSLPSRSGSGRLLPNVDIKADGGYVVAPPSMLLITPMLGSADPKPRRGERVPIPYIWADGCCPCQAPTAPEWLIEAMATMPSIGSAGAAGGNGGAWSGDLPPTDELLARGLLPGERSGGMYKLACRLWRQHGMGGQAAVFDVCRRVFQATDTSAGGEDGEPFTWDEALTCIKSGRNFIGGEGAKEAGLMEGSAEWVLGVTNAPATAGGGQGTVPPKPGGREDLRIRASRVLLLTEEERASPRAPARLLCAADVLESGTEPADIARTLARLSLGQLLWDPGYQEWHAWTGTHWNPGDAGWEDAHRQARRLRDTARRIARNVRNCLDDSAMHLTPKADGDGNSLSDDDRRATVAMKLEKVAHFLATKRDQRDVLGQVQSHDGIMVRLDDWPGRKNVLNFTNGTVSLNSETWWAHQPADLVTHCLPYAWDPSAQCPGFRYLVWCMTGPADDISGGHRELFEFVLRVLGYCLIYGNPAQMVFFMTGATKTGKTTVLEIVAALLGGLAHKSKPALITVPRSGELHDSVRWSIRGKRLVYVDETKGMMRIDVAALKDLSGGRTMAVRAMRASREVQAPVTFTIVIPTNEMPSMTDGDAAAAERLVRIPCGGKTRPLADRDPAYAEKIIASEATGILALLVYYARLYHRDGLPMPRAVTAASQEYMKSQDSVAAFAAERCTSAPLSPGAPVQAERGALFREYTEWCRGESHLGRNEFYEAVRKLEGVGEAKDAHDRFFTGIRIR